MNHPDSTEASHGQRHLLFADRVHIGGHDG